MIGPHDLRRSLDPACWFTDIGVEPDAWQADALRSTSRRQIWNVHRQGGKSTVAAAKALDITCGEPDSLVVVLSPSQRQSSEWLRSCMNFYAQHTNVPPVTADSMHRTEFANKSRILSLPSSEATVRGYARVKLLILDECSRIADDIIAAARPMIALGGKNSAGAIVALSTPHGRKGQFYEWFHDDSGLWEKKRIPVSMCERIDPLFLKEEMRSLGPTMYAQEYGCEFLDPDDQAFPTALFEACFKPRIQRLWQ